MGLNSNLPSPAARTILIPIQTRHTVPESWTLSIVSLSHVCHRVLGPYGGTSIKKSTLFLFVIWEHVSRFKFLSLRECMIGSARKRVTSSAKCSSPMRLEQTMTVEDCRIAPFVLNCRKLTHDKVYGFVIVGCVALWADMGILLKLWSQCFVHFDNQLLIIQST